MPEEVLCGLCGHGAHESLFWSEDIRHGVPGSFGWKRCQNCGACYLSPRPTRDEILTYYPGTYALFRSATTVQKTSRRFLSMQQRDISQRCRDATHSIEHGRLLDIGCGTGEFLAAMRQHGWETVGIEPNEIAASYARNTLGLDVVTGTLEDIELPAAGFDTITMWTVLEHLHDPVGALRKIRGLIRPNGLLVMSIPDAQSLDARLFGPFWVGYDTPRHLYVFSRESVIFLLRQAGFAFSGAEHTLADYYTFLASLEPWLKTRLGFSAVGRILQRIIVAPGMRLLTWPIFWMINSRGKGCIITVFARPNDKPEAPGLRQHSGE